MTTKENLFSHRFDAAEVENHLEVQDAIGAITDRAQGVLMLLSSQFNSTESISRMSDEIISNVIDSVIHDIDDIKTVTSAYFEAVKRRE